MRALTSSVHSYLIRAYSDGDKVTMNVAFCTSPTFALPEGADLVGD